MSNEKREGVILDRLREHFAAGDRRGLMVVSRGLNLDSRVVANWFTAGYVPAQWALHVERATEGKIDAKDVLMEWEALASKRGCSWRGADNA